MPASRIAASIAIAAAAVVASGAAAEAGAPARAVLYELRDGDSLSGIAARFHLPAKDIAELNHLKNPNLLRGAGLLLPEVASTRSLPRWVPWAPAPEPARCAVKRWSRMKPIRDPDCYQPACSDGPAGERACVCHDTMTLTTRDGKKLRVPLDRSPFDALDVELVDVDLDGDGRPETVISSHVGTSNGIAHEYRRLVVLRGGREILRYDSGAFGAQAALVEKDGRCHLASAHYEDVRHPIRGPALYLVERSFDPTTLAMDEDLAGARVAESERLRLPFDPLAKDPLPGTVAGIVVKVGKDLESLSVKTPKGIVRLSFAGDLYERLRVGDARTGRVYPLDFTIPLVGRRVMAKRYEDRHVAWLEPGG